MKENNIRDYVYCRNCMSQAILCKLCDRRTQVDPAKSCCYLCHVAVAFSLHKLPGPY